MDRAMKSAKTTPIPPDAIKQVLRYVITGHPYVKKSNMKLVMRGKKLVRIPTANYTAWATSAHEQIARHINPGSPINFPVNLQCHFYVRTYGVVDLSALYEGIQDELVKMGVLEDDNFKIVASHDGSRVFVDPENPRMEIEISARNDITIQKAPPRSKKKPAPAEEGGPF